MHVKSIAPESQKWEGKRVGGANRVSERMEGRLKFSIVWKEEIMEIKQKVGGSVFLFSPLNLPRIIEEKVGRY